MKVDIDPSVAGGLTEDQIGEILAGDDDQMWLYDLDYTLEHEPWQMSGGLVTVEARRVAHAAGIPHRINADRLRGLVTNADRGWRLHVVWYGNSEEILRPVLLRLSGREAEAATHVAWTDPVLAFVYGPTAVDVRVEGTVWARFDPAKLHLDDADRWGAGDYRTTLTLTGGDAK